MRLVCTDQLGITQPAAVERALQSGVQIRNYSGGAVYHPKVYLAHDRNLRPTRFLLGSANLSTSALCERSRVCWTNPSGCRSSFKPKSRTTLATKEREVGVRPTDGQCRRHGVGRGDSRCATSFVSPY